MISTPSPFFAGIVNENLRSALTKTDRTLREYNMAEAAARTALRSLGTHYNELAARRDDLIARVPAVAARRERETREGRIRDEAVETLTGLRAEVEAKARALEAGRVEFHRGLQAIDGLEKHIQWLCRSVGLENPDEVKEEFEKELEVMYG